MQNDLISRSALLKEFEKRQEQQTNKYCDCFLNDAQELSTEWWCVEDEVIAAPTIDAVEVVHGRWVRDDLGHAFCSKCRERLPYIHCYSEEPCSDCDEEWDEEMPESLYCPHCGAKMDGGAES